MKPYLRVALICAAFLLFTQNIFAQDSIIFIGGSFTHNGDLPKHLKGVPGFLRSGNNIGGADLQFSAKFFKFIGGAADISFSHSAQQQQFLFVAGPELTIRGKKNWIGFHGLVGGAYQTQKLKGLHLAALADSSFATEGGGFYERFLGKRIGLRAGVDLIYTPVFGSSEINLRSTFGLVFRL